MLVVQNPTGAAFFNSSRNKSESRALAHTSTLIGLLKTLLSFAKVENSIAVLKTFKTKRFNIFVRVWENIRLFFFIRHKQV